MPKWRPGMNDVTILTLTQRRRKRSDARIQRVQVAPRTPQSAVAAILNGAFGRYADEETEAEEADGAAPRVGVGEELVQMALLSLCLEGGQLQTWEFDATSSCCRRS